jgi:hypothetical protein
MPINLIEESNIYNWENYLKEFSSTFFLSSPFLEGLRDNRLIPIYLRFECNGKTVGLISGLSVLPVKTFLKKIYNPLFFYSGPVVLGNDRELIKKCMSELYNYAVEKKYTHLILESRDYPYEINFENKLFDKARREEYIIDLKDDWGTIKKRMRPFVPRQARKAERNELTFHETNSCKIVDDLISLMGKTKSVRLSKGYADYNYFYLSYMNKITLKKMFENKALRGFYVQLNDKIVSALLLASYNKGAFALFVGTDAKAYKLGASNFIYFNIIRQLKSEDYEYFNIGGIAKDSSYLNMFFAKTSLGAQKRWCWYGKTKNLHGFLPNLSTFIYKKLNTLIKH